jgi:hypothetical protein
VGRTRLAVIVAVTIGLSGCSGPASKATPGPVDHPVPAGLPLVLGLNAGRLVIEGSHYGRRLLPTTAIPGQPSLIVPNPAGGWVVSYAPTPDSTALSAAQQLVLVSTGGQITPFGPRFNAGDSPEGLAVSPDGRRVAVATPSGRTPRHAGIEVIGTPGHHRYLRTWDLAPIADEAISLSWSPDSRTLAYIAGFQTGAGIYDGPTFLDLARRGSVAPATSRWPTHRAQSCEPAVVGWLVDGRFAVLDECHPTRTERFRVVDPRSGRRLGASIAIGRLGCFGNIESAGGVVLVSWCGKVYTIRHGKARELPDHFSDAAPAGRPQGASGG